MDVRRCVGWFWIPAWESIVFVSPLPIEDHERVDVPEASLTPSDVFT